MKKKKHHGGEHEEGGEAWLLPYSDLMTLLLAVFIVLFAVSKMDSGKAHDMSEAFKKITQTSKVESPLANGAGALPNTGENFMPEDLQQYAPEEVANDNEEKGASDKVDEYPLIPSPEKINLVDTENELKTYFEEMGLEEDITTYIDERGLVMSLSNAILFDSGKADLKPATIEMLIPVGEILNKRENYIRVEGHTDNIPISSAVYPTNWELSSARAMRVARLLIDQCGIDPGKLVPIGYASFKPIAPNDTPEGRAQNRRVDIILQDTKYDSLEQP